MVRELLAGTGRGFALLVAGVLGIALACLAAAALALSVTLLLASALAAAVLLPHAFGRYMQQAAEIWKSLLSFLRGVRTAAAAAYERAERPASARRDEKADTGHDGALTKEA